MRWSHQRIKTNMAAMNIYGIPMSSSFVLHLACLEADIPFEVRWVDRASKKLADGRAYADVVSRGLVPALSLPDGSTLSETSAVLQYVADRAPEKKLAPPVGSLDRYRMQAWLNLITSEIHARNLAPIFGRTVPEEIKVRARENVIQSLEHVATTLVGRDYLVGESFTVADAYLWWALFALPHGGVALDRFPSLVQYVDRLRERPAVKKALSIEGPLYLQQQAA
jgi:glutathione S-transferase